MKADFSVHKIITDIEVVRTSLGVDKITLIGHAIHACMALEYASRFSDTIRHLVLSASSPIVGLERYKEADQYFEELVCPERKSRFATSIQDLFGNYHVCNSIL